MHRAREGVLWLRKEREAFYRTCARLSKSATKRHKRHKEETVFVLFVPLCGKLTLGAYAAEHQLLLRDFSGSVLNVLWIRRW